MRNSASESGPYGQIRSGSRGPLLAQNLWSVTMTVDPANANELAEIAGEVAAGVLPRPATCPARRVILTRVTWRAPAAGPLAPQSGR